MFLQLQKKYDPADCRRVLYLYNESPAVQIRFQPAAGQSRDLNFIDMCSPGTFNFQYKFPAFHLLKVHHKGRTGIAPGILFSNCLHLMEMTKSKVADIIIKGSDIITTVIL